MRGWGTDGYHEIILRHGSVELCYDPHEITNGVVNLNTSVYNICLVGNGSFTVVQEKAFDTRAKRAMKLFGLPVPTVKGHGEMPGAQTSCPGINMTVVRKRLSTGDVVDQVSKPKPVPSKPSVSKPSTTKKGNQKKSSVVDYLKSIGQNSSFASRKKLASKHGINNYNGTAAQNAQLLKMLRG